MIDFNRLARLGCHAAALTCNGGQKRSASARSPIHLLRANSADFLPRCHQVLIRQDQAGNHVWRRLAVLIKRDDEVGVFRLRPLKACIERCGHAGILLHVPDSKTGRLQVFVGQRQMSSIVHNNAGTDLGRKRCHQPCQQLAIRLVGNDHGKNSGHCGQTSIIGTQPNRLALRQQRGSKPVPQQLAACKEHAAVQQAVKQHRVDAPGDSQTHPHADGTKRQQNE